MMNHRLRNALVALLAVAAVGACDDPPIEPGNSDAARLSTNPSFVVVEAGASRTISASLQNDLGNPVSGDVTFSACNALISVAADPNQTPLEPGTNIVVTGVTLGESCVVVSGAGFSDTVGVRVVADELTVTAAPETVRAGDTGSIDLALVTTGGVSVGPFSEADVTWSSSNTARLFFTDDVGGFDTRLAGPVTVTATYTAFGVTRTVAIPITVLPNLPATGTFGALGATLAGDTASATATLADTIGNNNNLAMDIESIDVTSSDPSVATAYAEITEHPDLEGRVVMTIYAVGVSGGQADISATANTVNGAISLGTRTVTVVAPVSITSVLPDGQMSGDLIVIAGTNLQQTGSTTRVFIEGTNVTQYISAISPTAITLEMQGAGEAATYEITVDVGNGATTDAVDYDFGGEENEPDNDAFSLSAPEITVPTAFSGWFGLTDEYDFYTFEPATSGTLSIDIDWDNDDLDVDAYVYDVAGGSFICTASASASKPEASTCTVTAGNTYVLILNDYSLSADGDETLVKFDLEIGLE